MRVRLLRYSIGFLVLALGSSHTLAAAARAILHNVTVSPRFFNPSLGQTEEIRFQARSTERVTVSILDRDRFVIRTFWAKIVKQGPQAMKWDGKDDRGVVVPDEAYSIKIEFQGGKHPAVYDPSLKFMPISENPAKRSYSRTDGILTYSIARTSRVHIEAGEAVKNEKTGEWEGPILKTIVDRQPRIAGAISDKWSGFDEGGTIFVPDLKNFVISILATSLPENSIIAVGNRKQVFFDYAMANRPSSATQPRSFKDGEHKHHSGLNAFEDHSPALVLNPAGEWDRKLRTWKTGSPVRVGVELKKPLNSFFLTQPNELEVFCDGIKIEQVKGAKTPRDLSIDLKDFPPGEHRIALNWSSDFGPVAANAFRVTTPPVEASSHERSPGGQQR